MRTRTLILAGAAALASAVAIGAPAMAEGYQQPGYNTGYANNGYNAYAQAGGYTGQRPGYTPPVTQPPVYTPPVVQPPVYQPQPQPPVYERPGYHGDHDFDRRYGDHDGFRGGGDLFEREARADHMIEEGLRFGWLRGHDAYKARDWLRDIRRDEAALRWRTRGQMWTREAFGLIRRCDDLINYLATKRAEHGYRRY